MGLMQRWPRWATARPHVYLVEAPGGAYVRRAVESALDARGWHRSEAPGQADVLVVKPPPPDVQLVHDAKLASEQPLDLSQQYEPERILSGLAPSTKVGWRHDIAGAAPVYVMRSGTICSFGTVAKFSPRGVASAWMASSGAGTVRTSSESIAAEFHSSCRGSK